MPLLRCCLFVCLVSCVNANAQTTGFAISDGFKICYRTFGSGAPMILVHGWGSDTQQNWIDTGWVDALKADRRVIAIDVRGHGDSDKPHDSAAYSYAAMARDVLAVMDHLGIAKADLMGYSMGSFMGAWLAGHHADRFNSMILVGIGDESETSRNEGVSIAAALRAGNPATVRDPLGLGYRAYVLSNPRNTDLEALAVSALEMWPEGYPLQLGGEGLALVRIPVLIVNGSADPYAKTDERLAAAIPGTRIVELPAANHLTAIVHPKLKEVVREFLSKR